MQRYAQLFSEAVDKIFMFWSVKWMTQAAFSHGTIDNAIKQVITVSLWTKSYGVTIRLLPIVLA